MSLQNIRLASLQPQSVWRDYGVMNLPRSTVTRRLKVAIVNGRLAQKKTFSHKDIGISVLDFAKNFVV
jgi:hypothetical protein